MAANSNVSFHHGAVPVSAFNRHAIAFQSGAVNSSTGMIAVGNYGGMNNMAGMVPAGPSGAMNSMAGMTRGGNSVRVGNTAGVVVPGSSSTSGFLLETLPGLKHDAGLAVDWSIEEQSLLEEGLVKFADETSIMRYVKIAATLPDKTVRDVALRCRWMTRKDNGKRRNSEDHCVGKKMKDSKEKLVDSSPRTYITPQPNMPMYPFIMQNNNQNDHASFEVGGITRHLLDENAQVFSQITANLGAFKIQDNVDLFCRTRNNLMTILNEMRDMPGIMSQMPPLQVSINEELADAILSSTAQSSSQVLMFGAPSSIQLKQEPRC